MDKPTSPISASRRQVLNLGAKTGAFVLISGLAASLTGCNKNSKRVGGSQNRPQNMVGQPIPSDPSYSTRTPIPVYTPSASSTTTAAKGSLTTIPSFVIPRSSWTQAKTRASMADRMTTPRRITVHHDAISPIPSGGYGDSVRRLSTIRNGHLNNNWADIGYHYAIDPAGRAWQARPLVYQGAHVKNHNAGNIGIVLFGNFENSRPTSNSLATLNKLLAHEMRRFQIPLNAVYTHRELRSTACPGRNLHSQMNRLRSPSGALALVSDSINPVHHA